MPKKKVKKKQPGVIQQIRLATRNPLPALFGALLGAVVPFMVYKVVHAIEPGKALWAQPLVYMAAGGLVFSAKTVYQWAAMAFGCRYKAAGFVVLIEGVMTFGPGELPAICLAYLIGINAIATGAHLALAEPKAVKKAAKKPAGKAKKATSGMYEVAA